MDSLILFQLTTCMETSKGHSLSCNDEVQKFISTVDKLQFEIVRIKPDDAFKPNKKMTYAEKFKGKY